MTLSPEEKYEQVCRHVRTTNLLTTIDSLLGWDERTQLPPAAGAYRAEQMTLSGRPDPRSPDRSATGRSGWPSWPIARWPPIPKAIRPSRVRELKREYDKKTKLPKSLVEELARTAVEGQQLWDEARKQDSFATFQPLLERMVELKRQEADAPGLRRVPLRRPAGRSRAGRADVQRHPRARRPAGRAGAAGAGDRRLPAAAGRLAAEASLSDRGPGSSSAVRRRSGSASISSAAGSTSPAIRSAPTSARTIAASPRATTSTSFPSAFFGILHEAGHGMYDQGLRDRALRPAAGALSFRWASTSRSRACGRTWSAAAGPSGTISIRRPSRRSPRRSSDVPLADFHFAINDVRPSLIRVEADEVTYNLHIIIRFELEQALIGGDLAVADLPGAWNEKYQPVPGHRAPQRCPRRAAGHSLERAACSATFPTYSLGNLYAAQFFAQAESRPGRA